MRIIFATYGTSGDVQPLLAIALDLITAGHYVVLAAPPENEAFVQSYGCNFAPLGSNLRELIQKQEQTFTNSMTFVRFLQKEIEEQFTQLQSIFKGADFVFGSAFLHAGRSVAELMGIPYRYITFCPGNLPSSYHPSINSPNREMKPVFNKFSWWVQQGSENFSYRKTLNKKRLEHGMKPVSNIFSYFFGEEVIVASDPVLGTVPDDVKQKCFQTGYMHLHQKGNIGEDLERFLTSGPPPIYIGFGSRTVSRPERLTKIIIETISKLRQRLILSRGWAELGNIRNDNNFFCIGDVPHRLLFPRVSIAIHHGGAGTTAVAARSGIPQIICPNMLDQFYWGDRVFRLGLGPEPLELDGIRVDEFCDVIYECLTDPHVRFRANEIAQEIRSQNTLRANLQLIEEIIKKHKAK